MFTMFQVMTLDSWSLIARPLIEKQPWVGIFFVFAILVTVMVLLNLITAVIVENAFTIAKQDEEEQAKLKQRKKERELRDLTEIFAEIDADDSGALTLDEFNDAMENNVSIQKKLRVLEFDADQMKDLWDLLDDGDESITIYEFTNGLRKMKGDVLSKDLMMSLKQRRQLQVKVDRMRNKTLSLINGSDIRLVSDKVYQISSRIGKILNVCKRVLHLVEQDKNFKNIEAHEIGIKSNIAKESVAMAARRLSVDMRSGSKQFNTRNNNMNAEYFGSGRVWTQKRTSRLGSFDNNALDQIINKGFS